MVVKAIIFDYGNVLSLPQPEDAIAIMADRCGLSCETLERLYWDLRPDYDMGRISGVDYWHEISMRGSARMTNELAREMIDLDNKSWSRENHRMSAFAREVRRSGFLTAILSNMPLDFRNYLPVGVTWLPEFDHHTFSCEIRVIKPDPKIYEHSISGLGVEPAQALFLDDRVDNIAAARSAGLEAVLFESTEQALKDCSKICGLSFAQ